MEAAFTDLPQVPSARIKETEGAPSQQLKADYFKAFSVYQKPCRRKGLCIYANISVRNINQALTCSASYYPPDFLIFC